MSLVEAKARMTFEEYLDWASKQSSGRYELVDGEIVAMGAEGIRHTIVKGEIFAAFRDAIKSSGLPCVVLTDGVTVRTGPNKGREPDAAVSSGPVKDLNSIVLDDPVIVVEVVSPVSARDDTGTKLLEYFTVPTIQHYLIVRPVEKAIIHHRRGTGGEILTRIVRDGTIRLDPPGIEIAVGPILAAG